MADTIMWLILIPVFLGLIIYAGRILVPVIITGGVIYVLCFGLSLIITYWLPILCSIAGFIVLKVIIGKVQDSRESKRWVREHRDELFR